MTKHTSLAIALTVTTFLSTPAIAVSLTPTLEQNSAFSYSEGSENDYNFTLQEADAEGNLTTKYYKIDLKPETFATSKNISWTTVEEDQKDATDVVAVQLPNNQTKYFKYTYTQPEGRTVYDTHQDALTGDIDADFVDIQFVSDGGQYGGAVGNADTIDKISGLFAGNFMKSESNSASGGAIHNSNYNAKISNISSDFINNHVYGTSASGGAIYNFYGTINGITGHFIGNYVNANNNAFGGAIDNYGTIGNITGHFIGNYAETTNNQSQGGAIYSAYNTKIGDITGDFVGNYASGAAAEGGAISGFYGTIGNITGDFIGNYVKTVNGNGDTYGGAIYNNNSVINTINGNFLNNYAFVVSGSGTPIQGGAIYNNGTIGDIAGDFIGNYVSAMKDGASNAAGGAIYNDASIDNISGNFLNNYAQTISMYYSLGGAVYTSRDMTFNSDADVHFMSGNYVQDGKHSKIYNALFVETADTPTITFNTANNGAWVINDTIEGGQFAGPSINYNDQYGLLFNGNDTIDADTGTTTQYIAMNNDIVNAGTVTVSGTSLRFGAYQHEDQTAKNWDGKGAFVASLNADGTANRDAAAVTVLSLNNAVFDLANGYQDVVKLKGYSATDSFLHIDVDVENMKADMLNVNGNVEGGTKLIVHASSDADIRGKGEILFAESENDTTGNAGSFVVSRVYKSPYLFDINYTQRAENSNQWGLTMNDQNNPDKYVEPEEPDVPDVPTPELPDIPVKPTPSVDYRKVAPEVIAYQGLPAAALEQTKGMVGNVSGQITRTDADHTLWANAVYRTSENEALVNVDADVWGIEAGGDLQHDLNNKLGLFLSYRKGNYDMSGDGKHHYSTVGSQIDIDSYLAGLYYRYDRNHWWTFATVYGGIQSVDLKTKDGIKSDTDGTEFGGSVELGYDYAINKTLYLTPSVGAFYTQVDYDDATDSAGKIAKYNTLRQLELEAGVKLTKAFVMDEGYANVYVKPSVVRTITDGDEVKITGLGKVNTLDDQTLGRVEIGGRYGFTEQLSAYGWANHTFGDDYKASTFGLGLSYNW